MSDVFDNLAEHVDEYAGKRSAYSPFFHFEPWDCKELSDKARLIALEDGADINKGDFALIAGPRPRPFQTGLVTCTKPLVIGQAGSQVGKSLPEIILIAASVSHQLPYAFRYDSGADTGIPRPIRGDIIRRWGRRDSRTGDIIDYNSSAPTDPHEWNCGNIIGCGKFPTELLCPPGGQIWVGTIGESVKTMWWPRLTRSKHSIFPPEFIDTKRGNNGTNKQESIVYTSNSTSIHIKTYDQGHTKFESERAHIAILDEEPLKKSVFVSAKEHCNYLRMSYTPLSGLTWSRRLLLECGLNMAFYHATQFDSPYKTEEEIMENRKSYSPWERQSRIWGLHAEQEGDPYFDRGKINLWIQRLNAKTEWVQFQPAQPYFRMVSRPAITSVPGLCDTPIHRVKTTGENRKDTWRVYEDRMPGCPYVLGADAAEGSVDPDSAQDTNAAIIMRPPLAGEDRPAIAASIRSTLPTLAFARVCAYAMRHYNNALLAQERGVGRENEAMGQELEDWPYWFFYTTINDKTQIPQRRKGFNTKGSGRDVIFNLISDWLDAYGPEENPRINDEPLLKELAAAVVGTTRSGKHTRCDHTRNGTLDTTISFGILLYVFKNAQDQIRCNLREPIKETVDRHRQPMRQYPCGLSAMGYRNGTNKTQKTNR